MGEIVLNRMFGGTYNENEIGHEIINLFRDDNGDNYIYILSAGDYARMHYGKITDVILTVPFSNSCVEVIGMARELEPIVCIPIDYRCRNLNKSKKTYELGCGPDFDKYSAIHKAQIDYIKKNNVKYGGVYVDQIFKNAGATQTEIYDFSVSLTFKANYFRKPKNPIYLINEKANSDFAFTLNKGLHSTSQIEYFSPEEQKEDYDVLSDMLNNPELWEEENTTTCVNKNTVEAADVSFIQIMAKQNDELSYSNMLAYFLGRSNKVFNRFIKDVLGIDAHNDVQAGSFCINREKDNIDLLITTQELAIVVENKIKSKINGVQRGTLHSQLDKYYDYTEKHYPDKDRHYYIFAPDYNSIKNSLSLYDPEKRYKLIKYSILYKFFSAPDVAREFNDVGAHYKEFLSALKLHTSNTDQSTYAFTLRRFWEMICLKRVNE